MPANPWELRADVRPLEAAALRWTEIAVLMARRGDEIVDAARRATDGWDAAAAESYERHRRQVLVHLDRFTSLAGEIAGSLRAIGSIITASQKELDQAWTTVAMIPHDVVGESRYLVFRPTEEEDRGTVTRGQEEADEIRRRLALSLDQESTRLRSARAELVNVRTELTTLKGGAFPSWMAPGQEASGVGTVLPASTSVLGSAQSGVSALPPIAPLSVSMPDLHGLTGLSTPGLAPLAAAAANGIAARRGAGRTTTGVPPVGGMGAGAMGARAGTMSRGMASGRSGPTRLATPTLKGATDDEAARLAREKEAAKQAEKDAKRAALAEKRAERAARRAERESEQDGRDRADDLEPSEDDADLDAGRGAGAEGEERVGLP
ncbi:hypothetical protein [Nocardioides sp.]|uniref:hypothetical protein n=1 Tax=Nocardioides sp. TaxID=35761 RepID=UPI00262B49DF|nr:hypothetical protein [Nocardioides sp.]MCW2739114.1 hypothetical protein [Nocardioides sp.]